MQRAFEHKGASSSLCFSLFDFINRFYFDPKPLALKAMFFPSKENELKLANLLRKAEESIDVCVFAFTNDKFRDALISCKERGVAIRVISDDVCSKYIGSDIYALGAAGV